MAVLPTIKDTAVDLVRNERLHFADQSPLLLTKFVPPRSPEILLQRDRLQQQLNRAETVSLTLICAAAGSGKTTLLTQWYRQRQQQGDAIAWLSLELSDNTPFVICPLSIGSITTVVRGINRTFQDILAEESAADLSLFIVGLINQLHHCPYPLYVVLDDYQNICHPDIHQSISYLLDHAPASLHLVISSRCRPLLALSRLQIQEQLVEINDEDLRFTASEATHYFAHSIPTPLNQWDIQRLVATTEGWIAGMKIVTLSSRQSYRTDRLMWDINAHSRTLTRYLEEVIFSPLPVEVFNFLMQTSILNRLHPMLCNAVTGLNNSADMLAWIEQNNLFLSVQNENGAGFRYHPLMRNALLCRLQQSAQNNVHLLHERAGNWFAAQQLWAEAIRHTVAAGQPTPTHAEAGAQSLAEEGDIETMVRWRNHLPTRLGLTVELQLNLAWAMAHRFRFNDARQLLDDIELSVAENSDNLNHSTWVKLRVVRGICEAFADNIPGSIEIVEPLLQEIPCGDIWVDGLICNILSYCHLATLRPQKALDVQQRIAGNQDKNRNLFVKVYRTFVMAQGLLRQGDLLKAQRLASQVLQDLEHCIGTHSSSGATLAPILATIAWELGDTDRIDELLRLRLQMIDDFSPPEGLSHSYILLARQAMLNHHADEAESLLVHAEQLSAQRGWSGALALLLSEQVALNIKSENIGKAHYLFRRLQALTLESQTPKNRMISGYVALSQSRLMLAEDKPLAAAECLAPLVAEQEQCGEWLAAVHSRLLLAVALWRAHQYEHAATVCRPALQRALQQSLIQKLLDTGPELFLLLNYLRKKLEPHDEFASVITQIWSMLSTAGASTQAHHAEFLPLKLTEREHQTLRLIAEGYPNKSIARTLGISTETVKWHVKHLYEKLQASNRTQAVNQARKWHLLK